MQGSIRKEQYSGVKLYMGSCQNYGPFLGTLNNRCRISRDPKGDHNFDNHPYSNIVSALAPISRETSGAAQVLLPECDAGPGWFQLRVLRFVLKVVDNGGP